MSHACLEGAAGLGLADEAEPLDCRHCECQYIIYPKQKHFVFSRHAAQGANALGEDLEQELGWDRMSNNKQDHGSHPPQNFNPLARELTALKAKKFDPDSCRNCDCKMLGYADSVTV